MRTNVLPTAHVSPGARLRVLQPFITEVLAASAECAPSGAVADTDDDKVALEISSRQLTVDPWTRERLEQYSRAEGASESECTRMVTQSVALVAKCEVDLAHLESQGQQTTGSLYAAQAQLMLDAAVGQSLVMDIQRVIDDLLKSGRLAEARQLSKFHHQLRNAMFQLRGRIDRAHHSTLQDLANNLADIEVPANEAGEDDGFEIQASGESPADAPDAAQSGDEREPGVVDHPADTQQAAGAAATQARPGRQRPHPTRSVSRSPAGRSDNGRKAGSAQADLPSATISRRTVVLAGLSLLAAVWLGVAVVSKVGAAGPRMFKTSNRVTFAGTEGQVEDRWPSLFVTVKTEAWDGLSDRERTRFAQELSNQLSPNGYSGALVRGTDGVPLAEWLRGGGVRLLGSGARPTGRRGGGRRPIDGD